ncbi:cupin domain-containing protein [Algiphilus sp.]|uniref:cupin domain-containing protein n=1 Tax=Algiphilus sp. TaxID=1872431 RepID=UPI003B520D19
MDKYLITKEEIEDFEGTSKVHFLNDNARRINKSLGDLTGLKGFGFHLIEIEPGHESTEFHKHYHEDECVYILEGTAEAFIGDQKFSVKAGDFLGYRAGGDAHTLYNNSSSILRCIVVGQRLDHDVGDYPKLNKRIYRNKELAWNLVDIDQIETPTGGKK